MLLVDKPSLENRLASAGMFVRAHLDERLTLETIAEVAGLSPFHFHRLFRVAFGENLNAYVVRHRLQRAARELRTTNRPIIDIALECGYESPSAFGRAFVRAFDLTPSAYRAVEEPLPLVPNQVSSFPELPEPRIEDYPDRGALAMRIVGPYTELDGAMRCFRDIIARRGFLPEATALGLSYDSPDLHAHDELRFDACVTLTSRADADGARADGLSPILVSGGRHAVYRHRGPYARITHTFDLLIASWVLSGRVELRDAPFVVTYITDPYLAVPGSAFPNEHEMECDLAIPIL
jgi:AraC family transcriptional regulator